MTWLDSKAVLQIFTLLIYFSALVLPSKVLVLEFSFIFMLKFILLTKM